MAYLHYAGFEMLDAFYDIGTRCSFTETGRNAVVHVVGEGKFPAASIAFLSDVAFTVYDFWMCELGSDIREACPAYEDEDFLHLDHMRTRRTGQQRSYSQLLYMVDSSSLPWTYRRLA